MAIIILLFQSNHILYLCTIRVVTDSAQINNDIIFFFRFFLFYSAISVENTKNPVST